MCKYCLRLLCAFVCFATVMGILSPFALSADEVVIDVTMLGSNYTYTMDAPNAVYRITGGASMDWNYGKFIVNADCTVILDNTVITAKTTNAYYYGGTNAAFTVADGAALKILLKGDSEINVSKGGYGNASAPGGIFLGSSSSLTVDSFDGKSGSLYCYGFIGTKMDPENKQNSYMPANFRSAQVNLSGGTLFCVLGNSFNTWEGMRPTLHYAGAQYLNFNAYGGCFYNVEDERNNTYSSYERSVGSTSRVGINTGLAAYTPVEVTHNGVTSFMRVLKDSAGTIEGTVYCDCTGMIFIPVDGSDTDEEFFVRSEHTYARFVHSGSRSADNRHYVATLDNSENISAVYGKVVDSAGNALTGLSVTLSADGGKTYYSAVTDGAGSFLLPAPAGAYTLSAETAENHSPCEEKQVLLTEGEALDVGTLTEKNYAKLELTVTDSSDAAPLADVKVSAGGREWTSDGSGAAVLYLPEGDYSLRCAKFQYDPVTANVTFDSTKTTLLSLKLTANPSSYHIYTYSDLCELSRIVNGGNDLSGKTVILEEDIDMTVYTEPWTSIGTLSSPFCGVFDGQEHTIILKGPLFNRISSSSVSTAVGVKNLHLAGTLSGAANYTLAGTLNASTNRIVIDNCSFSGTLTGQNRRDKVSALIGGAYYADIYNCFVKADIESDDGSGSSNDVSGILGPDAWDVNIYNSYAVTTVTTGGESKIRNFYPLIAGSYQNYTTNRQKNCYSSFMLNTELTGSVLTAGYYDSERIGSSYTVAAPVRLNGTTAALTGSQMSALPDSPGALIDILNAGVAANNADSTKVEWKTWYNDPISGLPSFENTAVTALSVKTQPRLAYDEGDTLELTGLVVTVTTETNGFTQTKDYTYEELSATANFTFEVPSLTELSEELTYAQNGRCVTVSYGSINAESDPLVIERSVTAIAVDTANTADKTSYLYGEHYDPSNLVLTVTYSGNESASLTYNSQNASLFTFTDKNGADAKSALLTAEHNDSDITITYKNKTASRRIHTRAALSDAGLSGLSYQTSGGSALGLGAAEISAAGEGAGLNVVLPYATANNAVITLFSITNDANATVTENSGVTLTEGAGQAVVTVKAEDNLSTKTYRLNFTIKQPVALSAPTALLWDTNAPSTAKWAAVENTLGYSVQLYKDGTEETNKIGSEAVTLTAQKDLSAEIAANGSGTYYFKVRALGNGGEFTLSAPSEVSPGGTFHIHTLTPRARIEATHTSAGNIAYYVCSGCGKYFSDAEGKNEILLADTVIAVLPHSWASAWEHDEAHHWHECLLSGCTLTEAFDKGGYAEHVYESEADATCEVCGNERSVYLSYTITAGAHGKWTKGEKGGLSFTADAEYGKFIGVSVDVERIGQECYASRSGSTVVSLNPSYLETLSEGTHSIALEFTD